MPDKRGSTDGRRAASPVGEAEIDRDQLEDLASLGCTQLEAATWFGISQARFKTLLKDPELDRIWRRGRGMARIRIRRAQFSLAERNAAMATLLGRRYLGQRDEANGGNSGQITVIVDTGIVRDGD